jgi:cyclic pyranopterin phosphate synthase
VTGNPTGNPTGTPTGNPTDTLGRPVRDLRISVTDRCNFRCTYCMPKEIFNSSFQYLQRSELLSFEEIERVAKCFARQGVNKIRLTGGEPLLRNGLEDLVARLAAIPEINDVALTTNGALLARKAVSLAAAGLHRVTVSLDSLDDTTFMAMNDVDFPVQKVLDGIDAAAQAGLGPIKINMVVKRGVNDNSVIDMAAHFKGTGHTLRFIEYAQTIVEALHEAFPIEPVAPAYPGEVATRWRYLDGTGEIGIISSVTQPFCGNCTRARISAAGALYTCLFGANGTDLRQILRQSPDDEVLDQTVNRVWSHRSDRYSESRTSITTGVTKVEMSHIGG